MEFVLWGRRGSPLVPAHDVASSSWHKLLMDISAAARWGGGGVITGIGVGGGRDEGLYGVACFLTTLLSKALFPSNFLISCLCPPLFLLLILFLSFFFHVSGHYFPFSSILPFPLSTFSPLCYNHEAGERDEKVGEGGRCPPAPVFWQMSGIHELI